MTEKEISQKYSNIEDKVPSIWTKYEHVVLEISNDLLSLTGSVTEPELIRVISLVSLRTGVTGLHKYIDDKYSFLGLYPEKITSYNIAPEILKNGKFEKVMPISNESLLNKKTI